jgi:GNAT superfamily N-acetyltransferase
MHAELDIVIQPGTRADYEALAHYHYRAGPPATFEAILRAACKGGCGETIGVLIVSRPTLNARWREALWPGAFTDPALGARAERLNQQLRTISRVIVDPRSRGLGIATRLVRAYLDSPLTPQTEAVAAMSTFCGFFQAAGMREVELAPSRRDSQLRRALRAAGLQPWRLVDSRGILRLAARKLAPLEVALRRWANDSRATRRAAAGDLDIIITHAARTVANPYPVRAYGYDFDSVSADRAAAACAASDRA